VLFPDGSGLAFQYLQLLPLGFQALFARGAQALLFFDGGAVPLALAGRFFGVAAQMIELQARHGKARIGARKVVAQLAHLVVEGHAVFLAGLLQGAQALQLGFERNDLLGETIEARHLFIERCLPGAQRDRQFARFPLHGQRAGPGFSAAGDGVAVVANAIG